MNIAGFLAGNYRAGYSGFDSAPYRSLDLKCHFPQENATRNEFLKATCESKPLSR
jgi:hypothetical protein